MKANCGLCAAAKEMEKNALAMSVVAYHLAAFDSSSSISGIALVPDNAVLGTSAEHNTIWAAAGKYIPIPGRPGRIPHCHSIWDNVGYRRTHSYWLWG